MRWLSVLWRWASRYVAASVSARLDARLRVIWPLSALARAVWTLEGRAQQIWLKEGNMGVAVRSKWEAFEPDNPLLEFTVEDEAGVAVNLTGASAIFTIHEATAAGAELLRLTEAAGITILNQTSYPGHLQVQIPADGLLAAGGNQYWELWVSVGGRERVVAYGVADIHASGI